MSNNDPEVPLLCRFSCLATSSCLLHTTRIVTAIMGLLSNVSILSFAHDMCITRRLFLGRSNKLIFWVQRILIITITDFFFIIRLSIFVTFDGRGSSCQKALWAFSHSTFFRTVSSELRFVDKTSDMNWKNYLWLFLCRFYQQNSSAIKKHCTVFSTVVMLFYCSLLSSSSWSTALKYSLRFAVDSFMTTAFLHRVVVRT